MASAFALLSGFVRVVSTEPLERNEMLSEGEGSVRGPMTGAELTTNVQESAAGVFAMMVSLSFNKESL